MADPETLAQYNANNTTSGGSVRVESAPRPGRPSPRTAYNASNTTIRQHRRLPPYHHRDRLDGHRPGCLHGRQHHDRRHRWIPRHHGVDRRSRRPPTTPATRRSDATDGFRSSVLADHHAGCATYAGNTTPDEHRRLPPDVHRHVAGIPKAVYDANNTTPDSLDGFRTTTGSWAAISKAEYDANNVNSGKHDGYRRINPSGSWVPITEAEYNARNTTSGRLRWCAPGRGKEYSPPFTDFDDGSRRRPSRNDVILARFISGNDNGVPWTGCLEHQRARGDHVRRAQLDNVPAALKAVALGECGATLTLQTKGRRHVRGRPVRVSEHGDHQLGRHPADEHREHRDHELVGHGAARSTSTCPTALHRTIEIEPVDSSDLTAGTPAAPGRARQASRTARS